MQIRDLIPWGRKDSMTSRAQENEHPIASLQREMNRVFDSFWNRVHQQPVGGQEGSFGVGSPLVDVVETDKAVEVSVELPGLDEKDIEVSVTDDVLSIKGEKRAEREETRKGYYLSERSYGSFLRSIPVPPGVAADDTKAEFKKGVLTITLPKTAEAQAKVRKIDVRAG